MKPFRHVLLLGNAETLPTALLKKLAAEADFILATDGAADRALSGGLTPDAVIGDLDSVSAKTRKTLATIPFICVERQDNTDLEKALDWLLQKKCYSCTLCGFTGGRIDFTLGNILSLTPYVSKMHLRVCGPGWQMYPVTRKLTLRCAPHKRVSLLPYTTCRQVRSGGLYYPLAGQTLSPTKAGRSLSNQTTGKRFYVSLTGGFMWVYVED